MNKSVLIETPRLILRTPQAGDAKPLNDAINRSLPELQRWQPWAFDPSLETTTKFINDSINDWNNDCPKSLQVVVIYKPDNKIIAASGYNEKSDPSVPFYEIGYWLETSYTGMGLATELTNALTRYAFLGLKAVRVQIQAQAENEKSINVAKRCSYEHEATLKKTRIDVLTKQVSDDYVFARFNLDGLEDLEVSW